MGTQVAFADLIWADIGEEILTDSECTDISLYTSDEGTVSIDSACAYSGEGSVKVADTWLDSGVILEAKAFADDFEYSDDVTYHLSAYVKLAENDNTSSLPSEIKMSMKAGYVQTRGNVSLDKRTYSSSNITLSNTDEWQKIEAYLEAPAARTGSAYTFTGNSIIFEAVSGCGGIDAYFDKISLYEAEQYVYVEPYQNIVKELTESPMSASGVEVSNSVLWNGNPTLKYANGMGKMYSYQTMLKSPMEHGKQYYVSIWIKLDMGGNPEDAAYANFEPLAWIRSQIYYPDANNNAVPADAWNSDKNACVLEKNEEWQHIGFTVTGNHEKAISGDKDTTIDERPYINILTENQCSGVSYYLGQFSIREIPPTQTEYSIGMKGGSAEGVGSSEPIVLKADSEFEVFSDADVTVNGKALSKDEYTVTCTNENGEYTAEILPVGGWLNNTSYSVVIDGLISDVWGRSLTDNESISFTTRSKVKLVNPVRVNEDGKTKISVTVKNNEDSAASAILIAAACTGEHIDEVAWSESKTAARSGEVTLTAELTEITKSIRIMVLDSAETLRAYDDIVELN